MAADFQDRVANLAKAVMAMASDDSVKKDPKNVELFKKMVLNDEEMIAFKKAKRPDPAVARNVGRKLREFYDALI